MRANDAALFQMIHAARLALDFAGEMSPAEFFLDPKTQSAALFQILLFAEGARQVAPGFREKHAEVPWSLLLTLRDRILRDGGMLDPIEVWNTLHRDLPSLLSRLETLLLREDFNPV